MAKINVVSAASAEPVSIDEAQQWCRSEGTTDDATLSMLIAAARLDFERAPRRALITRELDWTFPAFSNVLRLPINPAVSVTSITYVDADGDAATVSTDVYELTDGAEPHTVRLKYDQSWPDHRGGQGDDVVVRFKAGYGDTPADVPEDIRLILLQSVLQAYDVRRLDGAPSGGLWTLGAAKVANSIPYLP